MPPVDRRRRVTALPTPRVDTLASTPNARPATRTTGAAVDSVERAGGTTRARDVPRTGRGTSLSSLRSTVFLPGGVQLTTRGFESDGFCSRTTAGLTQGSVRALEAAASKLCAIDDNPFKARGINAKVRAQLATHLEDFVRRGRDDPGRGSLLDLRARSASYALMVRLVQGLSASEAPLKNRMVEQLLEAAEREPHDGLQRHMLLGLEALPLRGLTAAQKVQRQHLVEGLRPTAPPYDKWFGSEPAPTLNVKQYVMDEFWRAEIASYRKAGFAIEVVDEHHVVATKKLEDPKGTHPQVLAHVELVQGETNVLDEINDPKLHMILYSGHAQLGAVAKWSLEHGPRAAKGDKVLGFFACRGKQWLGSVRRQYPGSQVLVSNLGTYGHDDRIVIQKMFEGIGARAGWKDIRGAVEKQDVWEPDNYLYPHDARTLDHLDLDGDGVASRSGGRHDLLFTPHVDKGRSNSISFKPRSGDVDPAQLEGGKLTDAVAWFNTEYFYWAEDQGAPEQRLMDRFSADGWFTSDRTDELVRVREVRGDDGKPVYRVQVNAAYGHQSADALGMIVTYGAALEMMKRLHPEEPESERRLRALTMTGAYVSNLVEYGDMADLLLQKFASRFGFPPTLTWPVVEKALYCDHDHEASDKVMRQLEKGMQYPFLEVNPARSSLPFRTSVARALDVLKKSDSAVARTTYEAIVGGRVKVDTLSDLSRPDYLRLRKELLPEGVQLTTADYAHLEHKPVLRAITSSIDGYMWDDRIYIADGLTPARLAETLVHEVNHVLNHSEEHYRGDRTAFVEEYRAYYAEALLREENLTPARCRELKQEVIREYGFKNVSPDDVPDLPPGVLNLADA
ncbi:MAG: hypothetical protein ABIJ09_25040 [Pseudomonadota bacterium]